MSGFSSGLRTNRQLLRLERLETRDCPSGLGGHAHNLISVYQLPPTPPPQPNAVVLHHLPAGPVAQPSIAVIQLPPTPPPSPG